MESNVFTQVDEALGQAQKMMQANDKVGKQINNISHWIADQEEALFQLYRDYEKEQKDVDQLKSMSLKNFFHTIKKDKSDVLEKEEREALEAKGKADRLKYEIEAEKDRLNRLRSRFQSGIQLKTAYENLLNQKLDLIRSHAPHAVQSIEAVNREILKIQKDNNEIEEAIRAGNNVLSHIDRIQDSLKSAENWGTYDMLGGGFMATMAKRGHMSDAQAMTQQLSLAMKHFNDELGDIEMSIRASLDLDGFLGVADYFFDGLFVDMSVQNRIHDAQNQVSSMDRKIQSLLSDLNKNKSLNSNRIKQLKEDIETIIVKAE